jgi:hypothetical protein
MNFKKMQQVLDAVRFAQSVEDHRSVFAPLHCPQCQKLDATFKYTTDLVEVFA